MGKKSRNAGTTKHRVRTWDKPANKTDTIHVIDGGWSRSQRRLAKKRVKLIEAVESSVGTIQHGNGMAVCLNPQHSYGGTAGYSTRHSTSH